MCEEVKLKFPVDLCSFMYLDDKTLKLPVEPLSFVSHRMLTLALYFNDKNL